VLYDISTDSHKIGGRLCEHIMFLSRKLRISTCSCLLALVPMHTILSGTLGSSGTFWNSPLASMAFLHSGGGWVSYCSDCSHRKCTFLWPRAKPFSMFLASCWLPNTDMTPKVASTFRQWYTECKAASKVFRRTLPKMALYGYAKLMTSKVIYSVRAFLGMSKDTGSVMVLTGSILFPPKRILAWLSLSMRILVMSHLSMWTVVTMASICGSELRLMSWEEKVIGM
jgi:hypothetical protein